MELQTAGGGGPTSSKPRILTNTGIRTANGRLMCWFNGWGFQHPVRARHLGDVRKLVLDGQMPIDLVKSIAFYMLQALDFLHCQANLVHGGRFAHIGY